MNTFFSLLDSINAIIWHNWVLYTLLGVGVVFTLWSRFAQLRSVTHGVQVLRGVYDKETDPGAISHFQALSAALSATVGLGNIGGVAVAIALGGPGAVFWMWVVGALGMALKLTEVAQAMLFRDTSHYGEPHGGPMWVASRGLAAWGLGGLGKAIGSIFCGTLIIATITGGNMFQAWNVKEVTHQVTGGLMPLWLPDWVPGMSVGLVMAVIVGSVILGGIRRIGAVTGQLVPLMCVFYLIAAFAVLGAHSSAVPDALWLIVSHAFSPTGAQGAFVGGAAGYAFLWGMKRALFSSEAGQGSAPIAHSAARSQEPIREAVVAGLEPLIDTLVICTLTALVLLVTGAWNRPGEAVYDVPPAFEQAQAQGVWQLPSTPLPERTPEAKAIAQSEFTGSESVFMLAKGSELQDTTGTHIVRVTGDVEHGPNGDLVVHWEPVRSNERPVWVDGQVFVDYPGAALTSHAFNRAFPGLGTWLILLAAWLFAISTMISWSYYGEQGIVFLLGKRAVIPYKIVYCILILVATSPLIQSDAELDALTALGTGVMLWANIPIMLLFGKTAMRAYHRYMRQLDAGAFSPEAS